MRDPVPYRNEEAEQSFTQRFYEAKLVQLYRAFENDTSGRRSGLQAALNSALFSIRIGRLHTRAFTHGLDIRKDIRFDEEKGYCLDQLPTSNTRRASYG